jgi:sulfoxide reductase catalytic subunit YedY
MRHPWDLPYSAVTPKSIYVNRRRFLTTAGLAAGALALPFTAAAATKLNPAKTGWGQGEKLTPLDIIASYNNYYEFGTDKGEPSRYANTLQTSPWTVAIEGEVAKPVTLDIDQILKVAPLEERIYRHRCVERWSIVVPWIGFPLSELLKQVQPTAKAKFVAFQTFYDHKQMPHAAGLEWPYVEGLRLDEAMHPMTLLCVGLYGETLLNQNGAPVRIVVPWKYGFKSIKSIVKIKFVAKEPPTSWNRQASNEYGFYSNVNPERDHPRWSQAKERRLPDFLARPTLKFNGYEKEVGALYTGMDLLKNY